MRLSIFSKSKRMQKLNRRVQILLNDKDVTNRCQIVDDKEGWVLLLKKNPIGGYIVKNDDVVKERCHGKVRIIR